MFSDEPIRQTPIDGAFDESTIAADRTIDALLADVLREDEEPERFEMIA